MSRIQNRWVVCLFSLCALASFGATGQKPILYFWYGCEACYQLEKYLQVHGVGDDWQRQPATIYRSWRLDTKLFVVFEQLQVPWSTQWQWMAVASRGPVTLPDDRAFQDFLAKHAIDGRQLRSLWQEARINQATTELMQKAKDVRHVPSVRVGDRLIDGADYPSVEAFVEAVVAAQLAREAKPAP